VTRRISVEIVGSSESVERAFSRTQNAAQRFSLGIGTILKSVVIFDAINAGINGISSALSEGTSRFAENARVTAQTAAVLKSTGDVSALTAGQVHSLGLELSNLSGIDDEVIRQGENVLLSFTNIRNSVGKGNDIFNQATKLVVDYAARTGKDVPTAAILLGRALEDPASKLTALSRAGIVFTKSQIAMVRQIEATKGVLAAQKDVLGELAKRYAGAAAAAGKTLPGQLAILHDRFRDLAGQLVGSVLPAFTKVITGLTDFVSRASEAHGFHAKLTIVWEGVEAVARNIFDLIGGAIRSLALNLQANLTVAWQGISAAASGAEDALGKAVSSVDWNRVWANARGIADGLQKRLEEIDFGKIGGAIGTGIAAAIRNAIPVAKDLAQRISDVIGAIDFNSFGKKLGPGLAAAVVTAFVTLTDPSFWLKNWRLTLSVALVAFGGSVGKVAGKLGEVLARPFVRVGEEAALALAGSIEKFAPKIGDAVLTGLLKLPSLIGRALAPLGRVVGRVFDRLGGVAKFTIKVLGIEAAIGAVTSLFRRLAHVIGNSLDSAWDAMKRKAIHAVLDIIEPFTHLPGFLGGGPFRAMKDALQQQLDGMVVASDAAAKRIGQSFSGVGKFFQSIVDAIGSIGQNAAGAENPSSAFLAGSAQGTPPPIKFAKPPGPDAGAANLAKGFVLPFNLQLEQAKADASGSQQAILKAARDIAAFVRGVIPKLSGDKLVGAYQELATVNNTITAAVKAAADKIKNFSVPLKLQVDQAKFDALGNTTNLRLVLEKIRSTAEKALKSMKLGLQGQLDAWNTIKSVNDQLKNLANSTKLGFKEANLDSFVKGLGLTPAEAKAVKARISQLGPGGTVPGQGVGAFGGVIGPGGELVVHTHVNLDGKEVAKNTTRHQQRGARRNPPQRRGPFAGGGL
jgi:hypothetical protein